MSELSTTCAIDGTCWTPIPHTGRAQQGSQVEGQWRGTGPAALLTRTETAVWDAGLPWLVTTWTWTCTGTANDTVAAHEVTVHERYRVPPKTRCLSCGPEANPQAHAHNPVSPGWNLSGGAMGVLASCGCCRGIGYHSMGGHEGPEVHARCGAGLGVSVRELEDGVRYRRGADGTTWERVS